MFTIEVHQNPFIAERTTRVEAVLRVTAAEAVQAVSETVEGLVLDVSNSMQGAKLAQLAVAAQKAVELLPDEAFFFVVAFNDRAQVLPLAQATLAEKTRARATIRALAASGGTRMSSALAAARAEVAKRPGAKAHVIFLTDGENNDEDEPALAAELDRCRGVFQADCRGVGTDWKVEQLRRIADALLGTAKLVAEPAALEEDFRGALEGSRARVLGNVRLRLASPKAAKVKLAFAKQVSPTLVELAPTAGPDGSLELTTGAWASGESRDFHLAFDVAPGAAGDSMLVARPSVVAGASVTPGKPVLASWTPRTDERSALLNSHVAHYTGQTKLSEDIRRGLEARAKGDVEQATVFLGRAVEAAAESGNAEVTVRLRELVEERADGTVSLKSGVSKAKVMDLDLSSIVTSRASSVETTP